VILAPNFSEIEVDATKFELLFDTTVRDLMDFLKVGCVCRRLLTLMAPLLVASVTLYQIIFELVAELW